MQLQGRILQGIWDIVLRQRRANGTHNYSGRHVALNNEAADHDVVAGLHQATRGNVV